MEDPGMQRHPWRLTCIALAVTLLAGAGTVSAKIYHWVDKAGTPHFSDRVEDVPAAYRGQIEDYGEELEQSRRVNIIEGLKRPSPDAGVDEGVEYGSPPSAIPEIGQQLPGFAADPAEMLDKLKGPMMALAVVLTLVVCGFLFAFMTICLLVGCRLVGQESPGFKKAYGIVIVQFLAGLVAGPGVVAVFGGPNIADLGGLLRLQAINMGVFLLVHSAVLRGMLCDSMGKSIGLAIVMNLVLLGLAILLGLGFAMCAGGAALLGAG
jgi:hypothetical protein